MDADKTTRRIAWEAAKMLQGGSERDLQRATLLAARRLFRGRVPEDQMPDEQEVRGAMLSLAGQLPSSADLRSHPGSGADLDTGGDPEAGSDPEAGGDRFAFFAALLRPLETVLQPPQSHPEGDVLYHSLQVFDLVRDDAPYDEELLLAALLHDVGKAVDPREPIAASLELLGETISQRTRWLIENHPALRAQYDGSISARRRRSLRQHPWYEDLQLLAEADRDGRQVGVAVPDAEDALQYIAGLASQFESD